MKKQFVLALLCLVCFGSANASNLAYQAVPNGGVALTFTNVDALNDTPPAGVLHCLTGTRRQWASTDGGQTFWLNQMIGGCGLPDASGRIVHTVHQGAANRQGVLCVIPVWVYRDGRFFDWSLHPEGPTKQTARSGGMITALYFDGQTWRPATAAEAYGCD